MAEVAYLSLRESGMKLVGVMDDEHSGGVFFGVPVVGLAEGVRQVCASFVISTLKRQNEVVKLLLGHGAAMARIYVASPVGIGKRVESDD